jgi:hypothetical protein
MQWKIKNRLNQTLLLIEKSLKPSETIIVEEIDEQIRTLEKKGLISVAPVKAK